MIFNMKPKLFIAMLALLVLCGADRSDYNKYIEKYSPIAIKEMYRSGIPASITLAQGLLESGAGLSSLASKGNNHFGIKCHNNWKGKTMRVDDDAPQECFRVYKNAEESFKDHSDFLRYWDRYKFLFDYELTDYKAWAHGLKKAGYATDKAYAPKLIKLIEEYDLSRFDTMKPDGEPYASRPLSPLAIEAPNEIRKLKADEEYSFSLDRKEYSKNGVLCIYALEGETYASIAESRHFFLREILSYNDLKRSKPLHPGDIVYLARKKGKTPRGLDKYIVAQDGEQLWDIAQRFGVKLKSLCRRNGYSFADADSVQLREGDEIKLR